MGADGSVTVLVLDLRESIMLLLAGALLEYLAGIISDFFFLLELVSISS
jgi:hypothetical protein